MDIQTAKQIRIADYLHSLGYSPIKQQGVNLWYKSPLREEIYCLTDRYVFIKHSSTTIADEKKKTSFLFWKAI